MLSAFMLMMKDHGANFDFEGADMDKMKSHMLAVA
jgi:anaerobic magnesium-protoporphyrin IX monomethyl ester cyclase